MKTKLLALALPLSLAACKQEEAPRSQRQPVASETSVADKGVGTAAAGGDGVMHVAGSPIARSLLEPGSVAPAFSATAHSGEQVSLAALQGRLVVLYFYPKDGTPGCTVEAQEFAENYTALSALGVVVLGVSTDDNESHQQFAEEHNLPFLLLPDPKRALAKAYGVGGMFGMSKRVTYLISAAGKIAKVYPSVTPSEHAEEILADARALASAAP